MIGSQRLLVDRPGAKEEGLSLGVGALAVVQQREVIEAGGGIAMIGPQRLLVDSQGATEKTLGLAVGPHFFVQF